tara:strand:+ start:766 stop:1536 length:771 start_codon:yes stop_codon:yes gene_type:complete
MPISIKTPEEIQKMKIAGKLAADVLEMIAPMVYAGQKTGELNRICHEYILNEQKAIPAPLNYHGFPKSICTSVNHVVCHGIPSYKEKLNDGDIINIDITVIKDGYHGDTSKTFFIGRPNKEIKKLVDVTYECMKKAILLVRPGIRLGDLGHTIQTLAEKNNFSVVREYCGHGIGKIFHEEPQVLHYGKPNTGIELKEGMTFTIEPMINLGKRYVQLRDDDWTVETQDKKFSAQWEHTILVTKNSFQVLTKRPDEDF